MRRWPLLSSWIRQGSLGLAAASLAACEPAPAEAPEVPSITAQAPTMVRLSEAQYANALRDLLGPNTAVPFTPEPDVRVGGLNAVGAGVGSVSQRGVERYELLALDVLTAQVQSGDALPWLSCNAQEAPCVRDTLATLGRRAWRRPLTEAELDQATALVEQAQGVLDSPEEALTYGVAFLLQSPMFIYRVEVGEAGPDGRQTTAYELASRLAFLLWNTVPDDALLDAAGSGQLDTPEGLAEQVDRLLADDRFQQGARAFFDDLLQLNGLTQLNKDPNTYQHLTDTLGASAREETLQLVDWLTSDQGVDLRELLTARGTFVNTELATLYEVRAPVIDGFARIDYPADSIRSGFLGQSAFLMLQSHPTTSSATLRGKFIRETFLCHAIPDPPAGVDTSLPEADAKAPTLRDRVKSHLEVSSCASCHQLMDPVGLALENFDGLGRTRTEENGHPIDPAGDLDGTEFGGPVGLGEAIAYHPDFAPCLSDHLLRYVYGRPVADGEQPAVDWLAATLDYTQFDFRSLLRTWTTSKVFRAMGEPSTDEATP